MTWEKPHSAEVIGGSHNALTEMPEPNAIGNGTPGERFVFSGFAFVLRGETLVFIFFCLNIIYCE